MYFMSSFPVVKSERLVLRGPKQKDIEPILAIFNDDEVLKYYGVLPYDSEEKAQKQIDWFRELHDKQTGLRWVITLRGEDTYIGDVGFYDYEARHDRAEIGYILSKKHWGNGIMSEAINAALNYGFNNLMLNRVQALIDPRNNASKRVAEKQGFRYEGTYREYEKEHGLYIDLDLYSLLRREWNQE